MWLLWDWATAKVNCRSELQKQTAETNCKSELQKRTAKANCRSAVELQNEPQTQNGAGVYLRATVNNPLRVSWYHDNAENLQPNQNAAFKWETLQLNLADKAINIVQRNAFRDLSTKYKCLENFVLYSISASAKSYTLRWHIFTGRFVCVFTVLYILLV